MITANLPARNFDETEQFYARLGFERLYRGDNWMIMARDGMWIEFFPHPELKPEDSWFSACLRLPTIDAIHAEWLALGLSTGNEGFPRIAATAFTLEGAPRMFTLLDVNGSLWRVLEMTESG